MKVMNNGHMRVFVFAATIVWASAGLTGTAAAEPILVSGFDKDIIAEAGNGAITNVTDAGVINNIFTLAEVGYTGVGGTDNGTPLTITNDTVTTQNGTVFVIDPNGNNAHIGNGTLTLIKADNYQDLQFLLFAADGDFNVTLNFSDSSTSLYSATGLGDWQGSSSYNAFAAKTSAPRRDTNDYNPSAGLYMREVRFTLSPADQAKKLSSIDIAYTSIAPDRASTLAVSGTLMPPQGTVIILQ